MQTIILLLLLFLYLFLIVSSYYYNYYLLFISIIIICCYYIIRVGLTLMVLGEIGNFSAYGFSPASLVAPLGTTTVIGMLCFSCLSLITKMNGEEKSLCLVTFAPR